MVYSMSCPTACGPSGGSVGARSCSKKNPSKTKHIFAFVLATAVLCVLSRAPVASAGIFPYESMELQVNDTRGGIMGSTSGELDSSLLSYAPLSLCCSVVFADHGETIALFPLLWCFIASGCMLLAACVRVSTSTACLACPRNVESTKKSSRTVLVAGRTDASLYRYKSWKEDVPQNLQVAGMLSFVVCLKRPCRSLVYLRSYPVPLLRV